MPSSEIIRQYAMSDAALIQTSDYLLDVAKEDIDQLTPFGVTTDTLSAVKNMRDAFSDQDSDAIWRGRLRTVTAKKATAEKNLRSAIRELMLHAKMKIGAGTPEYDTFGTANLARASDNELVRVGRTVWKVAQEFLVQLNLPQDTNQNYPLLDTIAEKTQQFDDLIDEQKSVIRRRDRSTQERRKKGNALYSELIRIASLGRELFADDEAHANDYRVRKAAVKAEDTKITMSIPAKSAQLLADEVTDTKRVTLTNESATEIYYDFKDSADTGIDPTIAERLNAGMTIDFDGEPERTYLHVQNFSGEPVQISYTIE